MYQAQGLEGSTEQCSGVASPHNPLRSPFGQVIGQTNAVSWRMQLPHMRQPNSAPFVVRSKPMNSRRGRLSRLYGWKGGWYRLGEKIGISHLITFRPEP
jgi:hypothetical protein